MRSSGSLEEVHGDGEEAGAGGDSTAPRGRGGRRSGSSVKERRKVELGFLRARRVLKEGGDGRWPSVKSDGVVGFLPEAGGGDGDDVERVRVCLPLLVRKA